MPDFWNFRPFRGLEPADGDLSGAIQRYLENRGMKPATDAKVWAFLGDGETMSRNRSARLRWRRAKNWTI